MKHWCCCNHFWAVGDQASVLLVYATQSIHTTHLRARWSLTRCDVAGFRSRSLLMMQKIQKLANCLHETQYLENWNFDLFYLKIQLLTFESKTFHRFIFVCTDDKDLFENMSIKVKVAFSLSNLCCVLTCRVILVSETKHFVLPLQEGIIGNAVLNGCASLGANRQNHFVHM